MAIYDLPGKTILSHGRLGVRIELNFNDEGVLELWISPRAETSSASRDRNWSNRDDHTRLFDRIGLRDLSQQQFVRCDYDPFHIVVVFQHQTLHLISLYDEAGVTLWFENVQIVDFKSDKADTPLSRDAQTFAVSHPDRGEIFHFAAVLESGKFTHQLVTDEGRSTYAAARLEANKTLAILGGLHEDRVLERAQNVAQRGCNALLEHNEKLVNDALQSGHIELRDDKALQKLVDINRRVLLSQQDAQGAIRAALNRIYYLIWARDGAIIECFKAHAGWSEGVEKWSRFLLDNPLVIEDEEPRGRTYGMLVSPITSYNARSRSVYLPTAAGWYDFWTGVRSAGGATLATAAAAFDSIPVHVRAGSILPVGPELQYTGEKPADPISLFVYAGADGSFELYEDQGLTFDYEHGAFSTIPIHWNDATRTLSIGARSGTFPGMLTSRTFQVILVSPTKAVGFTFTPTPDKSVTYTGAAMDVTL